MNYSLNELLDIPRLHKLLDDLYEISDMPSAVLDTEGNVLTASGWRDICTRFHRIHPETAGKCSESDLRIQGRLDAAVQRQVVYRCPMGLVDAAVPLVVDGRHLGNVFTGQLFLETPDEERFRCQAQQYGFDEAEYLAAMRRVPVITEEKLHSFLSMIHSLAQMLVEQGVQYRKQCEAEQVLHQEKQFSNGLLDSLPGIFYLYSYPELRLIRWNRQHETLLGFEASEMEGRHLVEWHLPEFREAVLAAVDVAMINEQNSVEACLLAKDGSRVPFILTGVKLAIQDRLYLMGIGIDISERKKAEEALSYSTSVTNAVLESTAEGIMVVGLRGELIHWNLKFVELLQIPGELLHSRDKYPTLGHIAARMAQPEEYVARVMWLYEHPQECGEDLLALKDGRYFERYSQPLKIGDEIVGRLWAFRDVSERVAHERERLKMEKLESLGVLAGGIAHDFNNILTAVIGNISLAQMHLAEGHKALKPLKEAEKASARASELSGQLLTFARGGEPVKKVIALQRLVEESVAMSLHGSNVRGVVRISEDVHAIEADEGQLGQVFGNIIINAAQAMPGGGTLTVTGSNACLPVGNIMELPAGHYVCLTFEDVGCGIAEADLGRIFDPYFTTKPSGNGLGLASVHSIVTRHGGHVSVSSVPGKGSTFTIHLPSTGATFTECQHGAGAETGVEHAGGRLLVMDDEQMILDLAREMLVCLGYRVVTCLDGDGAVSLYREAFLSGDPFRAVIMDLTIPGGMGGREAARLILEIDPAARLIVSSGYSSAPIMSDYTNYGFMGSVAKPYRISEISRVLEQVLAVGPSVPVP